MMRIWPRKNGEARGLSGTRNGMNIGREGIGGAWMAPGTVVGERQSRYTKGGSLDSRYSRNCGSIPALGTHMVGPLPNLHLHHPWHDIQQPKLQINPKGNLLIGNKYLQTEYHP